MGAAGGGEAAKQRPGPPSVYLDYNSSTPPLPETLQGAKAGVEEWGNPSSIHKSSKGAKGLLWKSRRQLAQFLSCHPLELIFTSGATEANNHALKGLCFSTSIAADKAKHPQKRRCEIIISAVEHASVREPAEFLKSQGFKILYAPVSREGILDEDWIESALSGKTLLVSVMGANNETGAIHPVRRLARKAKKKGALFHSDLAQVLGKIPVNLQNLEIDLASFSGHKFYGLKGSGILYRRKGVPLESLLHGGPQERRQRAGTENLPSISSFSSAASKGAEILLKNQELKSLRDALEARLVQSIPGLFIAAKAADRLPNTSCLCIPGVEGETLLINLDLKGFSLSAGSACHSGKAASGSVLTAMGFSEKEAKSCLRVSLGFHTTENEVKNFAQTLEQIVQRLRNL